MGQPHLNFSWESSWTEGWFYHPEDWAWVRERVARIAIELFIRMF